MRLESAHIKNFKLLENVDLTFPADPSEAAYGYTSGKRLWENIDSLRPSLGDVW